MVNFYFKKRSLMFNELGPKCRGTLMDTIRLVPGGWPKAVAAWTAMRQQLIPRAKVAKVVLVKVRLREVQKMDAGQLDGAAGWMENWMLKSGHVNR
jgi:hypothetical protein